jgi:hypothetical protein
LPEVTGTNEAAVQPCLRQPHTPTFSNFISQTQLNELELGQVEKWHAD